AILDQARIAGVDRIVEQELMQPRPLAEIVAGVTDDTHRATLYVLAFGILRGDEQPSGAERIYLAKLAYLLGLDPKAVQQLEENAGKRIDAQPTQSPAKGRSNRQRRPRPALRTRQKAGIKARPA